VVGRGGDLLISDPHRGEISRFAPDGHLIARFGTFGEAPGTFQRIGGLLELPSGRVAVVDGANGRVTILGSALGLDTTFGVAPRPVGGVTQMGTSAVAKTAGAARSASFTRFSSDWQVQWSVSAPSPGSLAEFPYWGSYASTPHAATTTRLFLGYSLRYPILVYDTSGTVRDSLNEAPPSFREASVLSPGFFATPDADERRAQWLDQFSVIALIAVFQDSLLAVVHGRLHRTAVGITTEHQRLDIYSAQSLAKILEDVSLPAGARVLGGGNALYVLTGSPPAQWTIVRAKIRPLH